LAGRDPNGTFAAITVPFVHFPGDWRSPLLLVHRVAAGGCRQCPEHRGIDVAADKPDAAGADGKAAGFCGGWTASQQVDGTQGFALSNTREWTQSGLIGCRGQGRLYCFEVQGARID
jgi:hypothetical protein